MLKTQHFELIKFIEKEIDLEKIAKMFALSERSIRYKINEINLEIGIEKLKIKKRKIISHLTVQDIEKLYNNSFKKNIYIYNPLEREELMILYTLLEGNNFFLNEISEKIGVSRSTIQNDIKIFIKRLAESNIYLKYNKQHYYYSFFEEDIRYFITNFIYKYVNFDDENNKISFSEENFFEKILTLKLREKYEKKIEKIYKKIKKIDFEYNFETLNVLAILMVVSKEREKYTTNLNENYLNKDILGNDYNKIKENFTNFKERDLILFSEYLFKISRNDDNIFQKIHNWNEVIIAISKIIKKIEIEKEIFIKNEKKLLNEILFYIKPLIFRTKKKIVLKNDIQREIKQLYPDIFKILKKNFKILDKVIGAEVTDNEIAYLVPFFYKALKEQDSNYKSAILISEYKENVVEFLKESIESEFLINIEKIYNYKFFDENEFQLQKYDYLITTSNYSKIKFKNKNKVIEINPVLTEKDIKLMESFGFIKNKKIKMSEVVDIILKNSSEVDIDNLIKDLNKNFSDKMYDDVQKNKNLLGRFLSKNNIVKINFSNIKQLNKIITTFLPNINLERVEKDITRINNEISIAIYNVQIEEKNKILLFINDFDLKIKDKKTKMFINVFISDEKERREIIYTLIKNFYLDSKFKLCKKTDELYKFILNKI